MAAMMVSPPSMEILPQVAVPTLVLHGSVDPLISPEAGRSVASLVKGARLEIIEGMGHVLFSPAVDILDQLIGEYIEAIRN